MRAALTVEAEGLVPKPEIMVPLVACVEEVHYIRKLIDRTAGEVFRSAGRIGSHIASAL